MLDYEPDEDHSPDRALPNSNESECGLLSSLLLDPAGVFGICLTWRVETRSFYRPAHQTIYQLLADRWARNQAIDFITLTQALRDVKQLDAVGGPAYVTELFSYVPTAANAGFYAETVADKARLRDIIALCAKVQERAYRGTTAGELDEELQNTLVLHARRAGTNRPVTPFKDLIVAALGRFEERHEGRAKPRGILSGIPALDERTGGWRGGQMIVISAPQKHGKSSLARQVAIAAALPKREDLDRNPVAIFSHEMGADEITEAILASEARVDASRLDKGSLLEGDFPKLTEAANRLGEGKVWIFDEAECTDAQFRANCRRAVGEFGVRLIVLDYAQLVRGTGKEGRREQEVAVVSRSCKQMAKELGIPIIVLSQVNADGSTRESRALEQDADIVIRIEHEDFENGQDTSKAWINLRLTRACPAGRVPVVFQRSYARFDPSQAHPQAEARPVVKNGYQKAAPVRSRSEPSNDHEQSWS